VSTPEGEPAAEQMVRHHADAPQVRGPRVLALENLWRLRHETCGLGMSASPAKEGCGLQKIVRVVTLCKWA